VAVRFIGGGNQITPEKTTDLPQVNDKLYHIMLIYKTSTYGSLTIYKTSTYGWLMFYK
jgi:hypothetical protein